jgi:hypothetical protein
MTIDTGKYNFEFFNQPWRKETASYILSEILKILPKIDSAVDFGCGLGAWLAVLSKSGIAEIKGYDGNWIDKDKLEIPKECFTAVELDKIVVVNKRYDLAISIEVAEHLPDKSAKIFVETLTNASDIVLFSAAIPYQGGENHLNEQWQSYWYDLFNEFGYVGIDIRSLIWNDNRIGFIQRQNIMLYVKKDKIGKINFPFIADGKYLNFVHPQMYLKRDVEAISLSRLYKKMIKRTMKIIIGTRKWDYVIKILKRTINV